MVTTNDFKNIVLKNISLIDVRAPIEFEKGAFQTSVNLPILTNEERHIIGICYKEKGNDEATKLGYEIVSGKTRENRISGWIDFIDKNPDSMIYCFRGGSRSTIAQKWISEIGKREIVKLEGGYKSFRNFLINSLEPNSIKAKPLILTGYTGSGKTILLNNLKNSIDLEGIANHRGSTFGHHVTIQPTQINFENNLAYEIIKHSNKEYKYIILEDESKNIGKSFIPNNLYRLFHSSDVIFLESSIEERVENILDDYVINGQKEFIAAYNDNELGVQLWYDDMLKSMERVKSKLGGDRLKIIIDEFNKAYSIQKATGSYDYNRVWIELFLNNYYDPMYKHSIEKDDRNIIFRGDKKAVLQYIKSLEK
ncbi:tRNA 2-selenouridine synthase [Clostridium disporicum]|uniref:tRNA 2-selenouridine synthase n=1 Tax=Clostridium disporicum TaxID=84024 RepID=A0A173YCK5_9CLOT|nr:tRNA 2-selenouridine synthase [Clostridium disporicum]